MKRILFLVMVLMIFCTMALADSVSTNTDEINAQVDKYFKQYKTVGGTLVIASHGSIVYRRDYGLLNRTRKTPVTDQTYFKLASVTKMVSAIGVMQLVEQGQIDLDIDISNYFGYEIEDPYFPDVPLTMRQAMSHTMPVNELGGYGLGAGSRTVYDLLSKDNHLKVNFTKVKPGTEYRYSNFGAGLMGSIIEKVTGKSINQYMVDSVFQPLSIDAAYSASLLSSPDDISAVHENGRVLRAGSFYQKQKYQDWPDPEHHFRTTVGALWIRSNDIAKLAIALCGDGTVDGIRVLSEESVQQMRAYQKDLGKSVVCDSPYGLCIAHIDNLVDGKTLYGHQGTFGDIMCNVYFDTETEFVFVMLTNGCNNAKSDRIGSLPRALFTYSYAQFAKQQ